MVRSSFASSLSCFATYRATHSFEYLGTAASAASSSRIDAIAEDGSVCPLVAVFRPAGAGAGSPGSGPRPSQANEFSGNLARLLKSAIAQPPRVNATNTTAIDLSMSACPPDWNQPSGPKVH